MIRSRVSRVLFRWMFLFLIINRLPSQKIKELEEEFQKRMLRERHTLSEEELKQLLEEHRKDKERLRKHKDTDRQNHDEKVREKLEEKRRKKLQSSNRVRHIQ